MKDKKKLIVLCSIFWILIIVLIYFIFKPVFPKYEKSVGFTEDGGKIETSSRRYKDEKTGIFLSVVERNAYYPEGQCAIKSIEINNLIYSSKSYKKDGTLLGEIRNYEGRFIALNSKGEFYPKDTVFPNCNRNCYYDYGAYLTEEEFKRRKNEKAKKEFNKFLESARNEY